MSPSPHPLRALVARHLAQVTPYRRIPDGDVQNQQNHRCLIRLDANECAFPLPSGALRTIADAVAKVDLARYPDSFSLDIAAQLAGECGGDPSQYVFGSGSDEVISLLLRCFSEPPPGRSRASVLTVTPSFVMYGLSTRASNLELLEVPLTEQFQLDVSTLIDTMDRHRPNIVFLASPNNPTGAAFRETDLTDILDAAGSSLVVLDAAYQPFADLDLYAIADRYPHAAVLGTLSKVGFAALRFGWCRLPPGLAEEVHRVRQPYNLSSLSQAVASRVLGDFHGLIEDRAKWVRQERKRVLRRLEHIPRCFPYPSDANFILFRVTGDPGERMDALRRKGIAIKNLDPYGGPLTSHLRVTIGTAEENDAFLDAMT